MHNKYLFSLIVLCALTFYSCGEDKADLLKQGDSGTDYSFYQPLSFKSDTFKVAHPHAEDKLSYYSLQSFGDTLYFHNQTKNEILRFNWRLNVALPPIKLSHLVNDTTMDAGEVDNVLMISSDSVLVVQDFRLALINTQGSILKTWPTDKADEDIEHAHGQWYSNYPILYQPDGKVYMHRFNAACGNDDFYRCPDYAIEAILDLNTGVFDTLPIKYSPLYKTRNYGQLREISRVKVDNKHIYSFESDPNLYVLDLQTDSVTIIEGKSKHHTADTLFYSYEKELEIPQIIDLYMQAPQYVGLWYDPYQQLLFRFFKAQQPLINEQDEFNSFANKELYLMVFDTDLKLLGEIHLGNSYSQSAFVTPDGLMVSKMSPNNPEYNKTSLLFNSVKIERKEQ